MEKMVVPILVKYAGFFRKRIDALFRKIKDTMIKKFQERDPEVLNILEGPYYPQATEYRQFISLCEVV
jgi:hypothetical protein